MDRCHSDVFERTAAEAAKEVMRRRTRKEGVVDRMRRVVGQITPARAASHWATVSVAVFVVVFASIVIMRPSFAVREDRDGVKRLSWFMVCLISLLFAGVCAFVCIKFCEDAD